jgi:hypothetical protein
MNPLAVVVDCDGKLLLGCLLPDDVLIQELLYFQRFRNFVGSSRRGLGFVVFENRIANCDAFIADVSPRVVAGGGDELSDYFLTLMAKGTP